MFKSKNNLKQVKNREWGIKEFISEIEKPLILIAVFIISAPYVTPNFIIKYNLEIPYILLFTVLLLYLVKCCALPNKSKNKSSEK